MSKHAVDTVALNALITAFQQSSDLSAKEVHKLITDVSSSAIAVTLSQPLSSDETELFSNEEVETLPIKFGAEEERIKNLQDELDRLRGELHE